MSPDPNAIDDYIQQNQARYTREAIREQLVAAGHDPTRVDEALKRLGAPEVAAPRVGWRPGWKEFFVLLAVGALGAAAVWAGQPYGAGGIAPIVYMIILSICFGVAKFFSISIDQSGSGLAAILMAIVSGVLVLISAINAFAPILVGAAAVTAVLAVVLFFLRGKPRAAGMLGAALPIIVWLLITGTCYAPLFASG